MRSISSVTFFKIAASCQRYFYTNTYRYKPNIYPRKYPLSLNYKKLIWLLIFHQLQIWMQIHLCYIPSLNRMINIQILNNKHAKFKADIRFYYRIIISAKLAPIGTINTKLNPVLAINPLLKLMTNILVIIINFFILFYSERIYISIYI